ncbi:CvpA family protein [Qingshengfaniella alkalisoli]|uniref:CvpA family protein n=1 Tax=Qingshengfaniella alkalisoli TaxID=2599296 RepID=A0A5B8I5V7_9RHOB|nr:CvpA family protein [Qingshengfaniella alkalisoli]QDY68779.1 CvpA family protein [Qingshengfaniella alkalisoli]
MEGFTIVDGVVAAVIVISALLAYSRGLVRELMAIAGWVAAAILAFLFAPNVEPLVKEIPYVGDFLRDSCELSIIAAFSAVFALALIVVSVFTPLFSTVVQRSALGGVDQGLGFLFGALRGILLVVVALIVYDRVVVTQTSPMVENSRTAAIFAGFQENLDDKIPEDAPGWVLGRYEELVGSCGAPVESAEPAPVEPTTEQ